MFIETRLEVKTQFECHFIYKSNHIFHNSMKHSETSSEILRFLNTIHDNLLKTLYMIYHKLYIGYHKPSTNLMIFQTLFAFYTIKKHCNHMWVFMIHEQNVQNFIYFMDKILKMIQLHEYDFSKKFTTLLYALVVQI
jgi:hypothetical protein